MCLSEKGAAYIACRVLATLCYGLLGVASRYFVPRTSVTPQSSTKLPQTLDHVPRFASKTPAHLMCLPMPATVRDSPAVPACTSDADGPYTPQ